MGIFGALSTAISGLNAQSTALEHISNNIANSQTTGYKRIETSFSEIVAQSDPRKLAGGVVTAGSLSTNNIQGDIQNSGTNTHMAVNGEGFFVIAEQNGSSGNNPTFSNTDLYTRRGDFELDRNNFLVNGAGYFLQGIPIRLDTGEPDGSQLSVVRIGNDLLQGQETTQVEYRANLPQLPQTAAYDPAIPGSELIDPSSFTGGPATINADEAAIFVDQTLAGGAITVFDINGNPVNVQLRWGKIQSADASVPQQDQWNLFYLSDSAAAGPVPQWTNFNQTYEFTANGQMDPLVTPPNVTIAPLTVDGVPITSVEFAHGTTGVSQFADTNGTVTVTELNQNGFAPGELIGVSVTDEGRIAGTYSNGETIDLYDVRLKNFRAPSQLAKFDGGAFGETSASGDAIDAGVGSILGGSLEGSNADIANEFSKLIVTQQAYAAGTRIVSTGDEMLQEALNMVR